MILGIGTDITEVARIKSSLERFGDSFIERILRPSEIGLLPHISTSRAIRRRPLRHQGKPFQRPSHRHGAQLGWHDMEVCGGNQENVCRIA